MNIDRYVEIQGTWFHRETPVAVRNCLLQALEHHRTVRLWYGDKTTGRAWVEEHDVLGKIGRSCGPVKVPLLIERGETGGGHLLDHCIVRIDVVTRRRSRGASGAQTTVVGDTVYRHASFHTGTWESRPAQLGGYAVEVCLDGEVQARFKTPDAADRYTAFMQGTGYRRP